MKHRSTFESVSAFIPLQLAKLDRYHSAFELHCQCQCDVLTQENLTPKTIRHQDDLTPGQFDTIIKEAFSVA